MTNRQYAVFLNATGARDPGEWRTQRFSSPDQPVVSVSWEEAVAFCRWLSEASNRRILLPSEAQWEFAARGIDGREYPWGNEPPDKIRACFDAPLLGIWGLGKRNGPAPVGSFPAGKGPFGTLDQSGNVLEWCQDAADAEAYAKRVERGREPVDPVEGEGLTGEEVLRVLRGGCWVNPADLLRAAFRLRYPASYRAEYIGFRIAAAPVST